MAGTGVLSTAAAMMGAALASAAVTHVPAHPAARPDVAGVCPDKFKIRISAAARTCRVRKVMVATGVAGTGVLSTAAAKMGAALTSTAVTRMLAHPVCSGEDMSRKEGCGGDGCVIDIRSSDGSNINKRSRDDRGVNEGSVDVRGADVRGGDSVPDEHSTSTAGNAATMLGASMSDDAAASGVQPCGGTCRSAPPTGCV